MKYLKLSVLLLSLTLFPFMVSAETTNEKLALEYLELSKIKETFDTTINTYVQQIANHNPSIDQVKIKDFFNKTIGWEVLKQPTLKIVSQTFTEKELKDIIVFYKSETGKSFAENSPKVSSEISKMVSLNIQKAMAQIRTQKQQ